MELKLSNQKNEAVLTIDISAIEFINGNKDFVQVDTKIHIAQYSELLLDSFANFKSTDLMAAFIMAEGCKSWVEGLQEVGVIADIETVVKLIKEQLITPLTENFNLTLKET